MVLVAVGTDPYQLVDAAVSRAAALSGTARPLNEKQVPASLDYFGWCSWDAFYSSVSAAGIFKGVQSLQEGNTPPKFVIIDDGWQQTDLDPYPDPNAMYYRVEKKFRKSLSMSGARGEAFLEAASKALTRAMQDLDEGTSAGAMFQELIEASRTGSNVDLHQLALEHESKIAELNNATVTDLVKRRWTDGIDTVLGFVMGKLQTLFVYYYENIVDPAPHGSWMYRIFEKLAHGPLRHPILDFIADQTNFSRRITDVRANSKFSLESPGLKSPYVSEDLKGVVGQLKSEMGVEYVICWHGIMAYWSGVSMESVKMQKYSPHNICPNPGENLLKVEPSMRWNPVVLAGMGSVYDPYHLYNDMHRYLSECGVAGVKVDCQAGINLVGTAGGGGASIGSRYHHALESSTSKHFATNTVINCMCHTIENIYHWSSTAVARASDDFYPSDKASHYAHITACAYNGVFFAPLVIPDYDMFQSTHAASKAHAIARAVSGGPVYVSDKPGKHNFDILRKLVLDDGRILRARQPAKPTLDCLFCDVTSDGQTALKLWTRNRFSALVAAFNVQGSSWDRSRRKFLAHNDSPDPVEAMIGSTDIPELRGKRVVLSYESTSVVDDGTCQSCTHHRVRARDERGESFVLSAGDSVAVQITPIIDMKGVMFCPIGLDGMINAGGAVQRIFVKEKAGVVGVSTWTGAIHDVFDEQSGDIMAIGPASKIRVDITGCPGSIFVAHADPLPKSCLIDDKRCTDLSIDSEEKLVKVPIPCGSEDKSRGLYSIVFAW
jgi:raffinose synthase